MFGYIERPTAFPSKTIHFHRNYVTDRDKQGCRAKLRPDRVQIHNHESHSWFGPPFASCEVMRSHYGPLGRTRGANPPDLSSIPGPCTSLHFFFLSFGVFGMGTQTGAHPPGPPFESRASKIFFLYPFFSNHSSFGQTIHGG